MKTDIASLLQAATQVYRSGLDAEVSGKNKQARADFSKAAECLLSAAELSAPAFRLSRMEMAERLVAHAAALDLGPALVSKAAPGGAKNAAQGNGEATESWLVSEKPETRFEDVAGLQEVKEQIRLKLIYPYSFPEKAARYGIQPGGGILLYGPPGTGKTMIARAVAGEVDAVFFAIKPSVIMSEWVGVAEKNIARLFEETRQYRLSVIFIDEFEALSPNRKSSGSTVMLRVVPQLLAELDGFRKRDNALLFIAATNLPWTIDSALLRPGRLDRLIYVPPPDLPARQQILLLNLKQAPLGTDVDIEQIAQVTERFSGADMAALCSRVREKVFFEAVHAGIDRDLQQTDFMEVLAGMRPSISADDLKIYTRFAQTGTK